ncbi:alpha/beta hydrolase [Croceitalea sp. MTPC9]|uniref:alpha/beta fold hydrolase n=1 Tax=unclassified Croceitalea TaxID=2632280 RepID=UPI002B36CBC6|nr:alpha/beta hydrolase [Croceitalea sp. MTPC6]GMN16551.1 alpha/beta hydrolase [Croceitalea sp. MTPC9]
MNTIQKTIMLSILFLGISVKAQYAEFKVDVVGKGSPVLLFPGFTCTGEVWEDLVNEISKTNECHVFTFAGFGGVTPIEKPWLPKIKDAINKYVEKQALKNTIIIGHSLGGALGLWLATDENHSYSKLIVVDALPSTGALMMPNFNSENIAYESPWNTQILEMDEVSFEKMASQMASGMSLKSEKHKQLTDWILKADRETYVYGYTDLLKLDLREDIAKIDIPVKVLGATHPYGLEMAKTTYENQYKNLETYDIEFAEGSAHFIMYDKPEWFLEKIAAELKN